MEFGHFFSIGKSKPLANLIDCRWDCAPKEWDHAICSMASQSDESLSTGINRIICDTSGERAKLFGGRWNLQVLPQLYLAPVIL